MVLLSLTFILRWSVLLSSHNTVQGVTFPSMHAMWGRWAPPKERTRLAAITYSGPYVGNVLSFPLSALLCQYGFDGGWPSVFYVFGSVGVVWFIFWVLLAHSTPADHPRISSDERNYIEGALDSENTRTKDRAKTPWFQILTSRPVWGLMIVYFCTNWGFYTLLTCIPILLKQTLGCSNNIPIVLNGIYSSIPYVFLSLSTLLSGPLADYVRSHWFSTGVTRKLFDIVGMMSAAFFLLICGYFGDTIPMVITFLAVSVGMGGFVAGGHSVNHLDIGASYAGILMGITNMCGTIPGFIGPQVAKLIAATPNDPKCSPEYISTLRDEWRQVLILSAEMLVAGALIFTILGSGKTQPWAKSRDDVITTSPQMADDKEDADEKTPLLTHTNGHDRLKHPVA
jgi:ACS family sodium-dependent inorganic phosphate cotransporter-like MFS transporter 5